MTYILLHVNVYSDFYDGVRFNNFQDLPSESSSIKQQNICLTVFISSGDNVSIYSKLLHKYFFIFSIYLSSSSSFIPPHTVPPDSIQDLHSYLHFPTLTVLNFQNSTFYSFLFFGLYSSAKIFDTHFRK